MSDTIGEPNTTPVAVHPELTETTTSEGAIILGSTVSLTVTVCVVVALFPLASVTVHVTVVVPNKNIAGALLVTVAIVQLSVVTGVPKRTPVAEQPVLAFNVSAAGATIVGLVESKTVTF